MLSTSLKGKRKASEEAEGNPKMKGKQINKEKEVLIADQEAKISRNPKAGGEEDHAIGSPKRSFTGRIFGIIMDPSKGKQKVTYPCDFCERVFFSPQALGGHQNSHKWERNLRQEIQTMNITKGRRAYVSSLLTNNFPGYEPLNENHGHMSNNILQECHPLNPYYKTGNNYQPKGVDTMFQHQANPDNGTVHGGRGFSYPPTPAAGFGTSSGMLHIGKNGAFQHPERSWFNPGFGSKEIVNPNAELFYEPPLSVGFNGGYGTTYGTLRGAFQHPDMARFNPGFETNNYGRVNTNSGMLQQRNSIEGVETQQRGKSGIDVLSTRNNQVIENDEVTTEVAEIDFGLVPKRDGKDKMKQQGETSRVDLALKL